MQCNMLQLLPVWCGWTERLAACTVIRSWLTLAEFCCIWCLLTVTPFLSAALLCRWKNSCIRRIQNYMILTTLPTQRTFTSVHKILSNKISYMYLFFYLLKVCTRGAHMKMMKWKYIKWNSKHTYNTITMVEVNSLDSQFLPGGHMKYMVAAQQKKQIGNLCSCFSNER